MAYLLRTPISRRRRHRHAAAVMSFHNSRITSQVVSQPPWKRLAIRRSVNL
jgi:hypothetical protein